MTTRIENTEWKPKQIGRPKSQSRMVLESMTVGDVKRFYHGDISCNYPGGTCSLGSIVKELKKQGREFEYYHEDQGVVVIRRLK